VDWSRGHVCELIDSYLTGALTPEAEESFEAHLFTCRPCLAEADAASAVALSVARLPADFADGPPR
jgi:anti-sigma factor RsiW